MGKKSFFQPCVLLCLSQLAKRSPNEEHPIPPIVHNMLSPPAPELDPISLSATRYILKNRFFLFLHFLLSHIFPCSWISYTYSLFSNLRPLSFEDSIGYLLEIRSPPAVD